MHLIRAVCFILTFATAGGQANSATQGPRARVELDEKMVRETVETVAAVVDREYFDREVASGVKEVLRERLQRGRIAGMEEYLDLLERRGTGAVYRDAAGFGAYMAESDARFGEAMRAVGLSR